MTEWFRRAGTTARDGLDLAITPGEPGWEHTGLHIVTLGAGHSHRVETGDSEWIVLPLNGSARVTCGGDTAELRGRKDVFAGPSDLVYVPIGSGFTVTSDEGARIALPHARASKAFPFAYVEDVPVELRGAGLASRQVNNFGVPGVLDADSIIACEVLTPSGNWSSYPPHKHDEDRPGEESVLEEIYYFELRNDNGADGNDPMGYLQVYGDGIDVLAQTRTGDVVLVPHGWHGPAMAPPGYDLYYLNVMAGPGAERAWLICDDPSHAWVRGTWETQKTDPRLPFVHMTWGDDPPDPPRFAADGGQA
jgi:5-deoxy-glucuronate isomerase